MGELNVGVLAGDRMKLVEPRPVNHAIAEKRSTLPSYYFTGRP